MNFGIIIQARLSSQRLPNKVIKPILNERSILDIIILRLKKITPGFPIILATGDNQKNNELLSYASKYDILFFSGSEDDVLDRFIQCAKKFKLRQVLRVCADNPFLDYKLAEKIIAVSQQGNYDYVSYSVKNRPAILSHYGFFSEVVNCDTLAKAHLEIGSQSDKEHVTPYIYNHPERFSIRLEETPTKIVNEGNIRLTVDTEIDFQNASEILRRLVAKHDFSYTFEDVLPLVKTMGNGLQERMTEQIILNSKS